jgi:hypothetical protein
LPASELESRFCLETISTEYIIRKMDNKTTNTSPAVSTLPERLKRGRKKKYETKGKTIPQRRGKKTDILKKTTSSLHTR